MKFYKVKGQLNLCFSLPEINNLLGLRGLEGFAAYCKEKGISFMELLKNEKEATELAKKLGVEAAKGDTHEVFAAFIIALDFYEEGSEICFQLKNSFIPSRNKINNLQDLISYKSDPPDFLIKSGNRFRAFELKRYIETDTSEFLAFLKEKLEHYGNVFEDTNLLIILQGDSNKESRIDFNETHNYLLSLDLKLKNSHILVSYNENNITSIMVEIYPDLKGWKVPFQSPSKQIGS